MKRGFVINFFGKPVLLLMLLLPAAVLPGPSRVELQVKQLQNITTAGSVLLLEGVDDLVSSLNDNKIRLGIVYGNENTRKWADRLEQWFVSLGVESRRIRKMSGVVEQGRLVIELQVN